MNGVFAVEKPSGVSSAQFISKIQTIFTKSPAFQADMIDARNKRMEDLSTSRWSKDKIKNKVKKLQVKIGHGGTLDPLASGVLIIGVGSGTKKLQPYLTQCTKVYKTKALLGISTTTGDCEGEIITKNPIDHITKEMVLETPQKFIGNLKQTPPIFSALKVNGKPLYEYAREGIPLPMDKIKVRDVKVNFLELNEDNILSTDHEFVKLESQLDENGVPKEHGLINNPTLNDAQLFFSEEFMAKQGDDYQMPRPKPLEEDTLPEKLPMVEFTSSVSSGTYIRSLISDFGKALESSAYMVELIRAKQGEWELGKNTFTLEDFEGDSTVWGPVLKQVLDAEPGTVDVPEALAKQAKVVEEMKLTTEDDGKVEEGKKEDKEDKEEDKEDKEEAEKVVPQKRKLEESE
ncbi:tRNA pseudouridine synthase 4 [Diutina rugosa]